MRGEIIKEDGGYTIRHFFTRCFMLFNKDGLLIEEYKNEKDAIKGLEKITNKKQDEVSSN